MHQNPDTSISHYLSISQPKNDPQESNIRSHPRYKLWPTVSPKAVPVDGRLVAEFVGDPVDVVVVEDTIEFCHLSTT